MDTETQVWKQVKGMAWTLVFWGWVVFVSFWLENTPVDESITSDPLRKFSDLEFTDIRFEQLYLDGTRLVMDAPLARFKSDVQELQIQQPTLQWENKVSGETFSASADAGVVSVSVEISSALPSEFNILQLSGNARTWNASATVDSGRMIFDNEAKRFSFPDSYKIRLTNSQGKVQSWSGRNGVYDPVKGRLLN